MKILVSGSSGLIGSALLPVLKEDGHEVIRLVRDPTSKGNTIQWDPSLGNLDRPHLEGVEAVVHLAGENIASGRWTKKRKALIRDSRVEGTKLLASAVAHLKVPPQVFICASAIGYYGDRGDEELDEQSEMGEGFLAELCRDWEGASDAAREKGIRVAQLRTGVVLSRKGGALKKMLLPFLLGAGGIVGKGEQYWSWIALDDVVGTIQHALGNGNVSGPINCVAPNAVTNREFTKTLGTVLKRPTIFPLPAIVAKIVLGQMAKELLLASTRVVPKRLEETGYSFEYSDLKEALRHVLGK